MPTDAQTFQDYRMRGDTILFDTVLPRTGVVAKRYVIQKVPGTGRASREKYIVPLNDSGQLVDSMNLRITEKH